MKPCKCGAPAMRLKDVCGICELLHGDGTVPLSQLPGCWPKVSRSMAVSKRQRVRAMELDAQKGVPTEYTQKGEPIFTGPGHMKQWLKANNAINYDGN